MSTTAAKTHLWNEGSISGAQQVGCKLLISLVIPAYNEADIIEENLSVVCTYVDSLRQDYSWEIILVDDGSTDSTGLKLDAWAKGRSDVKVLHHFTNLGLGQALTTAFRHTKGDYVVVLDADLSYDPPHIGALLEKIKNTQAQIVIASPYGDGGSVSKVPWLRRLLSRWANRFLVFLTQRGFTTATGMVRAYDGPFLRQISLKNTDMSIMPELLYKTIVLNGRIEEIPAHLEWRTCAKQGQERQSSMRVKKHILSTMLTGFMLRPIMFFMVPSAVLLSLAAYVFIQVLFEGQPHHVSLPEGITLEVSRALEQAYQLHAQTLMLFMVGSVALALGVYFFTLGLLSLQTKKYFEELFRLGTRLQKEMSDCVENTPKRRARKPSSR